MGRGIPVKPSLSLDPSQKIQHRPQGTVCAHEREIQAMENSLSVSAQQRPLFCISLQPLNQLYKSESALEPFKQMVRNASMTPRISGKSSFMPSHPVLDISVNFLKHPVQSKRMRNVLIFLIGRKLFPHLCAEALCLGWRAVFRCTTRSPVESLSLSTPVHRVLGSQALQHTGFTLGFTVVFQHSQLILIQQWWLPETEEVPIHLQMGAEQKNRSNWIKSPGNGDGDRKKRESNFVIHQVITFGKETM